MVAENNCTAYMFRVPADTYIHIHIDLHELGCFWEKPRNRKLNQEALALLALTCGLGFYDFVNLFNYSFPYLDNWIGDSCFVWLHNLYEVSCNVVYYILDRSVGLGSTI